VPLANLIVVRRAQTRHKRNPAFKFPKKERRGRPEKNMKGDGDGNGSQLRRGKG